ncbi:MAG: GDP-L-fucose synthase [Oligoflexales bacterium]|nr:GDP-L-fucose synthase [Oligoflexales bacterium]
MLISGKEGFFVAGHNGLVGKAIVGELKKRGYTNIICAPRSELDLMDPHAVKDFFASQRPSCVILAAAKVGGILANNELRADFIYQNLQIQNNVIWQAHLFDVKRLVFLGSSCIYPRDAGQPIPESSLMTSPLEFTNRPYAIAKIAGMELIDSLRRQHKRDYFSVMPTNLYGPGDNYHPSHSHVIPALIRRFVEAKKIHEPTVKVWGSGRPKREFMHSSDCARAIVDLAESLPKDFFKSDWSHINIGSGQEVSIEELAALIAKIVGYRGKIIFDTSKPDGTMKKLLDCKVLEKMGFQARMSLEEGLSQAVIEFKEKY